ncbi:HK97 family phage prohead protease [Candidatus Bealeia paramacronuclearis]|uniref:HK97 family phage prohead protease n=1 Tax=Candidatus Bealeia paramacronuclearis TaxID=1921001 RepID=A0ABZ2C3F8_9PROT|nr:HK97 family phage prohead protease [Candidatus Bealeia paramacronuclearis]
MYHKIQGKENISAAMSAGKLSETGFISGYASVFGVLDGHRDQVERGAFDKTLRSWKLMGRAPKMLWQHSPLKPIGVWTRLCEDARGLYVEGQLLLNVQQGREAYELIKHGALEGLSIGFRTIAASIDQGRKIRVLKDIDLLEVSLVTFASNTAARVGIY